MRLWSLHPSYLDTKGLLAVWREGLLAQKVLADKTRGYRNHPQLLRFKRHPSPKKAIGYYLLEIWKEAGRRGYSFEKKKVKNAKGGSRKITVASGQLRYEWEHLRKKLKKRDPVRFRTLQGKPKLHPNFRQVPGPVADWERT